MRQHELTHSQEAVLMALTDQRCANLLASADFIADLPEAAKDFLKNADPKTLLFLKGARPEEVDNLKDGIRLVVASRLVGRTLKWSFITLASVAFGLMAGWDKLVIFFGAAKH